MIGTAADVALALDGPAGHAVAHFVDDDQRVSAQAGDLGLEAADAVGGRELVGPGGGGGEGDAVAGLASLDAQAGGECGLAVA